MRFYLNRSRTVEGHKNFERRLVCRREEPIKFVLIYTFCVKDSMCGNATAFEPQLKCNSKCPLLISRTNFLRPATVLLALFFIILLVQASFRQI